MMQHNTVAASAFSSAFLSRRREAKAFDAAARAAFQFAARRVKCQTAETDFARSRVLWSVKVGFAGMVTLIEVIWGDFCRRVYFGFGYTVKAMGFGYFI